jgi:hypothetical protein
MLLHDRSADGQSDPHASALRRIEDWTMGRTANVLNKASGQILYRFHARDVHLVMGPSRSESPSCLIRRVSGLRGDFVSAKT